MLSQMSLFRQRIGSFSMAARFIANSRAFYSINAARWAGQGWTQHQASSRPAMDGLTNGSVITRGTRAINAARTQPFSSSSSSTTAKPASATPTAAAHSHDTSHHSHDVVMGPGTPTGAIGTEYQHSVGLERLEYLAKVSDRSIFLMDPLVIDHYGTLDNPIMVESLETSRITGCTGFPRDSHEVIWMNLEGTGRCPECGQAFKIKRV